MNLLFIGFGNTGKSIANKLKSILEIKEIYYFNKNKIVSNYNSLKIKEISNYNIDYCIITLSTMLISKRKKLANSSSSYELRHKELKDNIKEIKILVPYLKKTNAKIIIVSNPIDEIVTYLTPVLKNKEVIGFGVTLDSKRYSKKLNKIVDCIGTHGKAIPLINLKNKNEYHKLHSKIDKQLVLYVAKHGIPYELVTDEFNIWFKKLISKKENTLTISKYITKEIYGLKNVALSLPYFVKNRDIIAPKKLNLTKLEKQLLKEQGKLVKDNLKKI